MPNNPNFPHFDYFEIEFTKTGDFSNRQQLDALTTFLRQSGTTTDLFAISHGWNNDINDARQLYVSFFNFFKQELDRLQSSDLTKRKFTVVGYFWPSKKFADADILPQNAPTASGKATATSSASVIDTGDLLQRLDLFESALDDASKASEVDEARSLVSDLADYPSKQRQFVDLIRGALPQGNEAITPEDASIAFFKLDAQELINRLSRPTPLTFVQTAGDAAGLPSATTGTAAPGNILSGIKGSFIHLMNYTTYYIMKDRAGTVGRSGGYEVLKEVRTDFPSIKIHLAGHSFGGRLVTAAADGPADKAPVRPETMVLLQAAYSHNGLGHLYDGVHDGFFRPVVSAKKVKGPILITHSKQDTAVGIAYPIASMLSGVTAAALGDKNDPFGGMGRNGAQKTPEAIDDTLLAAGKSYNFNRNNIFNLNGDDIITGHGDVCRPEIASAVLQAIALM